MKEHTVIQGSREWYQLRLGKPTASQFHRIVTPTGRLSTQANVYMYRLICERLLKESMDDQLGGVQWVERGQEMQPNAIAQFQLEHDVRVRPIGFATSDDGRMGCSPDGIVMGRKDHRGLEIKCPAPWTHMGYLLEGGPADYRPQVQGQILVCGFDAVHFYSYHPLMPPCHIINYPDPAFLRILSGTMEAFLDMLDKQTERARSLGAYVVPAHFAAPLDKTYAEQGERDPLKIVVPE
jgi:hypothetical protein